MKIKSKIVHLLGGITKEEFNVFTRGSQPMIARERPIKTIKAAYCVIDSRHAPSDRYLENELMTKIANKIIEEKLIQFYTVPRNTDEGLYPQDVIALLKVVPPDDFGEGVF